MYTSNYNMGIKCMMVHRVCTTHPEVKLMWRTCTEKFANNNSDVICQTVPQIPIIYLQPDDRNRGVVCHHIKANDMCKQRL